MEINVLGIDTAKLTFHLCGMNRAGKVVYRKQVSRNKLCETVLQSGAKLVALEACGGSHHWARTFTKLGLNVKLIAPQFVKAYVKSNKTDHADAEAIAEAASRPTMRFVSVKTIQQQDLQSIHRLRERCIKQRTATCNELRGLLHEYGIIVAQGFSKLKKFFIEDFSECQELTDLMKQQLRGIYEEILQLNERVERYNRLLTSTAKNHPVARRLSTIPGVGPICATAIIAACGAPTDFKNGRHFASWLGLVPREHSSGGKQRLLGISKRGNSYLRKQLVHGARSVVYYARGRDDRFSLWVNGIRERKGANKAVVACANKNARMIWALIATDSFYQPHLANR